MVSLAIPLKLVNVVTIARQVSNHSTKLGLTRKLMAPVKRRRVDIRTNLSINDFTILPNDYLTISGEHEERILWRAQTV